MNPAEVHFSARNNAPWQDAVPLTITDEDGDEVAFDFGDYLPLQMIVRAGEFVPAAEVTATSGNGMLSVETDGALGINIPESELTSLVGTYHYDVRGTSGGDQVVLMFGTVIIEQGITYT